jgi:hypothetical protein
MGIARTPAKRNQATVAAAAGRRERRSPAEWRRRSRPRACQRAIAPLDPAWRSRHSSPGPPVPRLAAQQSRTIAIFRNGKALPGHPQANVFVAVEHSSSELVGIHASRSANRFEAWAGASGGISASAIAPGVARGQSCVTIITCPAISRTKSNAGDRSFALLRARAKGNGVAERFIRGRFRSRGRIRGHPQISNICSVSEVTARLHDAARSARSTSHSAAARNGCTISRLRRSGSGRRDHS